MVGEPFNLFGQTVGIEHFERLHNPGVEGTPALLQETPVRDLLGEGVLEGVDVLGEELQLVEELGGLQVGEARCVRPGVPCAPVIDSTPALPFLACRCDRRGRSLEGRACAKMENRVVSGRAHPVTARPAGLSQRTGGRVSFYRRLGDTGLSVSVLGFGGASIGFTPAPGVGVAMGSGAAYGRVLPRRARTADRGGAALAGR